MSNNNSELEQIKTDLMSLKIRLKRLEDFISCFPNPTDYLPSKPDSLDVEDEEMVKKAIEAVSQYDMASASLLQRRLGIGYARAARLIDLLESKGIIGKFEGASKPRKVLINKTTGEN